MNHGTRSYYVHGCRCDECREANAVYQRKANARRRSAPMPASVRHGSQATYVNWGCRCEPCTKANTMSCTPYVKAYRARQKASK